MGGICRGWLVVIFLSPPLVTRGLSGVDANNWFKIGVPDLEYLPRGNPGLDPGSIRPWASQTSGVSQNRLKDQAQASYRQPVGKS
jgi:hypothetical protein